LKREAKARRALMHEKRKLIERVVVGLVASAIAVNILAVELPRLMPYLVALAVIYIAIRIALYHTRDW
jgi:hypothetical protein